MLPARFHQFRDRALAQVDHVFAETVRITPMKDGQPDPDRSQVFVEAILRVGEGKETTVAGSMARSWRSRITAQRGELHIDRAKYPSLVVRKGDAVRALARLGEPLFEALAVDDRGATRMVVQLGEG